MSSAATPLDTPESVADALAAGTLINITAINQALAPIVLSAAGLAQLGFEQVAMAKASKLYHASDVGKMRAALVVMLAQPSSLADGREFMEHLTELLDKAPRAYRLAARMAAIVDCATSAP